MTRNELMEAIVNATGVIEGYLDSPQDQQIAYVYDQELTHNTLRLMERCYLLLPPRGPTTSLDCPHCTNPVKVTLSK